ncbi:redoxin domain-containing protein [bacterium]|nr:redoxin domain-containing protein [bacterium]
MRDREEELRGRKARIVVVTFENDFLARVYVEETSLHWPLLVDDTRETYRAYGMLSASFWEIWGPKTWWAYLKEILKGEKLRKSEGDISQRGGDVLIDPEGIVALHHIGVGPADRPPVERLLQAIDRG